MRSTTTRETIFGNWILGQTLGEGEFGKVKMGWPRRRTASSYAEVAIKVIRKEQMAFSSSKLSRVQKEIDILKKMDHPNIVKLIDVLNTTKYIGIVLEYASGGELFNYILKHKVLKVPEACRLYAQLVSGVDYLHKNGIVHRDLKLENLLMDRNQNIIITDFGFANYFHYEDTHTMDFMETSCGSPCYAAPELVVSKDKYRGRQVDVWSCGIILYAMLAGYLPFDDDPNNPDGDNINLLYQYIITTPLTFPEYIHPIARDLIRCILVADPDKRLTLDQIKKHIWMKPYHSHFIAEERHFKVLKTPWQRRSEVNRRSESYLLTTEALKSLNTNSKNREVFRKNESALREKLSAPMGRPRPTSYHPSFAAPTIASTLRCSENYKESERRRSAFVWNGKAPIVANNFQASLAGNISPVDKSQCSSKAFHKSRHKKAAASMSANFFRMWTTGSDKKALKASVILQQPNENDFKSTSYSVVASPNTSSALDKLTSESLKDSNLRQNLNSYELRNMKNKQTGHARSSTIGNLTSFLVKSNKNEDKKETTSKFNAGKAMLSIFSKKRHDLTLPVNNCDS